MSFYLLIYVLSFLISKIISKKIEGKYPKSILLPSGNYFIVSDKGINVYNPDFTLNNSLYNFKEEELIQDNENFCFSKQTLITKYSNEYNIFIFTLVKGLYLYIFENNNYSIKKFAINNINNKTYYYNLIPYYFNISTIEYIISFFIEENEECHINFIKFRISFINNNFTNEYISNHNFTDISNKPNNDMDELILSCQDNDYNIKEQNKEHYLICFYSENNKTELTATIFDIKNNFNKINSTKHNYENQIVIDIKSSKNKEKIFICSNIYNHLLNEIIYDKTYCFFYDIQKNTFEKEYIINNSCHSLDIYYFQEIKEYNLICYVEQWCFGSNYINIYRYEYDNKIKILKFRDDFPFLDDNSIDIDINQYLDMYIFSLIFNRINDHQYNLIRDCKENETWYILNIKVEQNSH